MIKKLILFLVARMAKKQEHTARGGVYAIDGQVVACHLCKQVVRYPPIRIPLGPPQVPQKDAVFTKEGFCLNPETFYGRFHITCALRWLVALRATDLEFEPQETDRDEPDSG